MAMEANPAQYQQGFPQYGGPQIVQRPSYVAGPPVAPQFAHPVQQPGGTYGFPPHAYAPQPMQQMQARVVHGLYGAAPIGFPGAPMPGIVGGVLPGAMPTPLPSAAPSVPGQGLVGLDLNRDGRPDLIVGGGVTRAVQQDGYGCSETMPGQGLEDGGVYLTQPGAGLDYGQEVHQPDSMHEEPVKVSMTVPEGAGPGTKLQYSAPDGQELRLTVPEGVPAGSVMTLTQDPNTKQWKCMAEPADSAPEPPQPPQPGYPRMGEASAVPQLYGSQPPAGVMPGLPGPATVAERVTTYVTGQPPMVTTYSSAGGAPTVRTIPSQLVGQAMPVNLSYVPPPVGHGSVGIPNGQVVLPGQGCSVLNAGAAAAFNPPRQDPGYPGAMVENRPSYTPPPVTMIENRPSYTPLPQVIPGGVTLPNGQVTIDPNLMGTAGKVQHYQPMPVNQSPSYVPPPMVHNSPSYVPPPGAGPMPGAGLQGPVVTTGGGPSITTMPPQVGMHPHVVQHHLPPGPQWQGMPMQQMQGFTMPGLQPMGMPHLGPPPGAPVMQFGLGQPMGGMMAGMPPMMGAPMPGMQHGVPGMQQHMPGHMQFPMHSMPGGPPQHHGQPMQMHASPEGMAGAPGAGPPPTIMPGGQHEEL